MLNEKSFFRLTSINKIYLQMSLESCTFVVGYSRVQERRHHFCR